MHALSNLCFAEKKREHVDLKGLKYGLRLLRTFADVLGKKIRVRSILKENTENYISLESLINVDFGKKYKLQVSSIPQKEITINRENDHVSFN